MVIHKVLPSAHRVELAPAGLLTLPGLTNLRWIAFLSTAAAVERVGLHIDTDAGAHELPGCAEAQADHAGCWRSTEEPTRATVLRVRQGVDAGAPAAGRRTCRVLRSAVPAVLGVRLQVHAGAIA